MPDTQLAMKLGRNDPCHCGSGKKYKRCHEDLDREMSRVVATALPQIQARIADDQARVRRLRDDYGLDISFVPPVLHQGQKVWAIGDRVYMNRPPNETFHEFILDVLRQTLGEDWRAAEASCPEAERHFVLKCFEEFSRFKLAETDLELLARDGVVSAPMNGWVSYLIGLAWDVATLVHRINLPDALVGRLRDRDQYQGARYEIAIAAMFSRLGCSIRFLDADEALRRTQRVEFEATHPASGQTFAVEAKSRQRPGVINRPGPVNVEDPLDNDRRMVRQLFTKALKKAPEDKAYFIFIDINAPLDAAVGSRWRDDIERWMARLPVPTAQAPDPYTGLFITNFSPHYAGHATSEGETWLAVLPEFTRNPMAPALADSLLRGLNTYGRVPAIDQGGFLLDERPSSPSNNSKSP